MSFSWQEILMAPEQSLREALEVINIQASRVVLIVDKQTHLLGVITDGDIRRALLNNLGLEVALSEVMNTSPICAEVGTPKEQLIETMEQKGILSIPVVRQGKVVGLQTLKHVLSKPKFDNPVFLMAGGFGTRLRPLTDHCPKPMLQVGNKPILETVLKSFVKAGFSNFYISTHYMPEQIEEHFGDGSQWGVEIEYVHEESPLGTGGALGLLPKSMRRDLPLILMNGDVLTKVDFARLLEFHCENGADATMCVREYEYQIPYGVIQGEGSRITDMVEKPIQRFFVNAGIYVVSPEVISSVPFNHRIDMPTVLEQRIAKDKDVLMFPIHEYWLDIGRMDDFNRAQVDIRSLGMG
ncbi:D-glycero-alpha-D-manno-heptose 1-phosphate guanylyltransferase [Pseudoalteromonas sp. THAF3]|uniref:nucleotidyltransferase family protein n=1 Tax=Pseudoalteromonas sp. THAF3 TaxID=2587843 RepID=UPI001267E247|nr:nucleotidyltransferase family protein [Pseudoalteromonas sp. THAF3]QFU05536.1 D-glycero-alpha-D-manno-heptose 1-phosphate guanylyltransferase [Pseudoalteromonas sp. THAF3]